MGIGSCSYLLTHGNEVTKCWEFCSSQHPLSPLILTLVTGYLVLLHVFVVWKSAILIPVLTLSITESIEDFRNHLFTCHWINQLRTSQFSHLLAVLDVALLHAACVNV